jgi:hypothetical protein
MLEVFSNPAKTKLSPSIDFPREFYVGRRDTVLCMSQLQLSAWAYHRILKLARTIAVLAGSDAIQFVHLEEVL